MRLGGFLVPDPTLNATAEGQGPAFPVTGPGGVSGPGVIPPSQGLTKHDAMVQTIFLSREMLESLATNGGNFTVNKLEKSEDFSATKWNLGNATNTANAAQSPLGGKTASRLTEDGTAGVRHRNASDAVSVTAYELLAVSIYAKAETRTKVYLGVSDGGYGDFADVTFDLDTLQAIPGQLTGGLAIIGEPTIEDIGAGWLRLGIVVLNTNQPSRNVYYGLADADGNQVYTGDGASSALFWGAQLENKAVKVHAYKAIPTITGAVSTFQPDQLARFVRDFATEIMAVRGMDLSKK